MIFDTILTQFGLCPFDLVIALLTNLQSSLCQNISFELFLAGWGGVVVYSTFNMFNLDVINKTRAANKTGFNLIILHFNIRGKLSII